MGKKARPVLRLKMPYNSYFTPKSLKRNSERAEFPPQTHFSPPFSQTFFCIKTGEVCER